MMDKELESFVKVSGAELSLTRETIKTLNEASIIAKKMSDEFFGNFNELLSSEGGV